MNQPFPAEPDYLVLHALRLKGVAGPEALAVASGLGAPEVHAAASALEREGLVLRRTGRVAGWALTGAGRERHGVDLAAELEAAGCREIVERSYQRLLALDEPFKALCTSWQMRQLDPPIVNDHTDAPYDAQIIDGLAEIHAQTGPVTEPLAAAMDRFGAYPQRFDAAFAQVDAGATDYFTRPLIGSYHDVWMELHEDLLLTLGIARREGST